MYQRDESQLSSGDEIAQTPLFRSNVNSDGKELSVGLVDSRWMAETYPETFQRHPIEQILRIPKGMFVKVICYWPVKGLPSERFWVEITEVVETDSGGFHYFGLLRNDTLMSGRGERIGPMTSECFCDMDIEKFVEERAGMFDSYKAGCASQSLY